jgi:hypothetical protein
MSPSNDRRETVVRLDKSEQDKLSEANRLLTELTEGHHHTCARELCRARWLTDVQDAPGAWTIPDVTLAEE